jgi:hypothetical protein
VKKRISALAIAFLFFQFPSPANSDSVTASDLLRYVIVAPESASGTYQRTEFDHWLDEDGDGCDTRQEVLIEETRKPLEIFGKCKFLTGDWLSLFDNTRITDPSKIDIDHFVPLKEAWESGASKWTDKQRDAFANDLGFSGSLIAVSASSNRSKGDRDPAQWLPRNKSFVCKYAVTWVQVKIRWSLTIDSAEQRSLRSALGSCSKSSTHQIPSKAEARPSPSPSPTKSESPAPEPSPSPSPTKSESPAPEPSPSPSPSQSADNSLPIVRGGTFCKKEDEGKQGRGSNGTVYTCRSDGNRLRWR